MLSCLCFPPVWNWTCVSEAGLESDETSEKTSETPKKPQSGPSRETLLELEFSMAYQRTIRGVLESSWGGVGLSSQAHLASLVAQLVKNPPAMRETWIRSLGFEDPLEKGTATQSSILAWRIPWTTVHGVAKSLTRLRDFHRHCVCVCTFAS